ncbi:MAG TPA: helix-turn-helix domain-containing protein, partial [Pyrinomonadaceae bacterium]|nr:helix-turn-helix domain-containing protein [Pyrinomonadaceae bacterium]
SAPATPPAGVAPFGSTADGASVTVPLQNVTLADALAEVERRMIAEALRKHNGNISRAARELGLTRRGLYLKLDRHQMSASA